MKRMDRYRDESDDTRVSRSDNNKELYESIGSNTRYTSFTDVTNANAIDLSSKKNSNRREGYHQMKEYQDVIPTTRTRKDLDEFKSIYHSHENKVYDINNVLEEARKNRLEKDALDEKRKLKNTSYNILASLNPEELEKYREEKKEKPIRADDEDLRELIDTIASATLAGDIKVASELLGDLMATSIMDKVEAQTTEETEEQNITSTTELPRAIDDGDDEADENVEEEKEETKKELSYKAALEKEKFDLQELKKLTSKAEESVEEKKEDDIMASADDDFYTRSMDLSAHDFDFDDDFREKKMPFGIKLLIFLIILVVLAAVFYFLWQNI